MKIAKLNQNFNDLYNYTVPIHIPVFEDLFIIALH